MNDTMRMFVAVAVIALSPPAKSQAPIIGHAMMAERLAAQYAELAGSEDNALALVMSLRTGTAVQLAYPLENGRLAVFTLEPPTAPMAWGDVDSSLHLAMAMLHRAGVAKPSGEQLEATLGRVLRLRADGLDWIEIAGSTGYRVSDGIQRIRAH
jgi:hypothetical protein